MPKHDNNVT